MEKCPYCQELVPPGEVQCPRCGNYLDGKERVEKRCICGSLVAKLLEDRIEIKCRRCKRIVGIKIEGKVVDFFEAQQTASYSQKK